MSRSNEQLEAIAKLRKMLRPGDTVYTIVSHVSRSGMQRSVRCLIGRGRKVEEISWLVCRAIQAPFDRNNGGVKRTGCGMDMCFDTVYCLGSYLWPKGTKKPHGTRNGEPDSDGGYALKHYSL